MKSNIPKHPCANKCTDFKEEQCKTCLVQDFGVKQWYDVPNHHILEQSEKYDFLIGDVVVLTKQCRNFYSNDLFEIKGKATQRLWSIKSSNHLIIVATNEIRSASVAELQAKRRLTEAEQALAEVS